MKLPRRAQLYLHAACLRMTRRLNRSGPEKPPDTEHTHTARKRSKWVLFDGKKADERDSRWQLLLVLLLLSCLVLLLVLLLLLLYFYLLFYFYWY